MIIIPNVMKMNLFTIMLFLFFLNYVYMSIVEGNATCENSRKSRQSHFITQVRKCFKKTWEFTYNSRQHWQINFMIIIPNVMKMNLFTILLLLYYLNYVYVSIVEGNATCEKSKKSSQSHFITQVRICFQKSLRFYT